MAKEDDGSAASSAAQAVGSEKATETLSQFVARVLNQLSLSAWLPAAALVLLLTFVVELAEALDRGARPGTPAPVIQALTSIAKMSVGGALLVVAAVVVLTMVTQAFSFEAIRVLEGYWGTNRVIELAARLQCARHRRVRATLEGRLDRLTEAAWRGARRTVDKRTHELAAKGRPPDPSPKVIEALRAMVLKETSTVKLTKAQRADVDNLLSQWRQWAPPDLIRRHVNVEKRLTDYPQPHRILPTKLGNVLRHYEDETGIPEVESFIQRVYDDLPLSMRVEHDEQRTRLDLYCSMVFVVLIVATVAAIRLAASHPAYAVSAAVAGLLAMSLMYRAGVASARAYGGLLVVMAEYIDSRELTESQQQASGA